MAYEASKHTMKASSDSKASIITLFRLASGFASCRFILDESIRHPVVPIDFNSVSDTSSGPFTLRFKSDLPDFQEAMNSFVFRA